MTTIDTSTEAVERLTQRLNAAFPRVEGYAGPYVDETSLREDHDDASSTLLALLKERDEARAALAASQPADPDGVLHDPDGHWGDFLRSAVQEAEKAMRKFPQPNYVISKVAEEAGEVVKAAIHAAEGRETLPNLRAEMRQLVAMLYRLWMEGDAVHGLPPVSSALAASLPADPVVNAGSCQPVRVKPLVWEHGRTRLRMDNTMMMGKGYDFDTMELTRQEGYGFGCGYIIWAIRSGLGKKSWNVYGTLDGIFIQDIASEDAAKDAAQADYEARILAELEPAPHVNETPKREHDSADVLTALPAPVTLAGALQVPEVQALVVTLQYTLKLCEDGHPVSAKNLAHACLRAIGEGEA